MAKEHETHGHAHHPHHAKGKGHVRPSERAKGKFEAFMPDGTPARTVTHEGKEVPYAFRTEAEAEVAAGLKDAPAEEATEVQDSNAKE